MNRFFKIFSLLIVGLFLLVTGVDAALDHLTHSVKENSYTLYSPGGDVLLSYSGDLALCDGYAKPEPAIYPRHFFHRMKAPNS